MRILITLAFRKNESHNVFLLIHDKKNSVSTNGVVVDGHKKQLRGAISSFWVEEQNIILSPDFIAFYQVIRSLKIIHNQETGIHSFKSSFGITGQTLTFSIGL